MQETDHNSRLGGIFFQPFKVLKKRGHKFLLETHISYKLFNIISVTAHTFTFPLYCMYVCIYIYIYICVCVCVCVYIYNVVDSINSKLNQPCKADS